MLPHQTVLNNILFCLLTVLCCAMLPAQCHWNRNPQKEKKFKYQWTEPTDWCLIKPHWQWRRHCEMIGNRNECHVNVDKKKVSFLPTTTTTTTTPLQISLFSSSISAFRCSPNSITHPMFMFPYLYLLVYTSCSSSLSRWNRICLWFLCSVMFP